MSRSHRAAGSVGSAEGWPAGLLKVRAGRRGAVILQLALALPVILGFISLGIEVGVLLHDARRMQSAADSAAIAAARAVAEGAPARARLEAQGVAAEYGYVDGVEAATIAVNRPPTSGSYTGDAQAVEVLVRQPQTLPLASLFHAGGFQLSGRAVALASGAPAFCVLVLDSSAAKAVNVDNHSTVLLENCGVAANSSDPAAIQIDSHSVLTASTVSVVGGYRLLGGSQLIAPGGIQTGAAVVADPYLARTVPSFSGCGYNNYAVARNATRSLDPGTYCNGLSIGANSRVTFREGIYIVDRGNFAVAAGATISGTGVSIVLTTSTGAGIGRVQIAAGTTVGLSAPSSGDMAGIAFYQDRRAGTTGDNRFEGGSQQAITGALYFPRQRVRYEGGTAAGAFCLQIVSRLVILNGLATVKNDCAGGTVTPGGASSVRLVE